MLGSKEHRGLQLPNYSLKIDQLVISVIDVYWVIPTAQQDVISVPIDQQQITQFYFRILFGICVRDYIDMA